MAKQILKYIIHVPISVGILLKMFAFELKTTMLATEHLPML